MHLMRHFMAILKQRYLIYLQSLNDGSGNHLVGVQR
jgi:hypothetical protein